MKKLLLGLAICFLGDIFGNLQAQNVKFVPPVLSAAPQSDSTVPVGMSVAAMQLADQLQQLGRDVRKKDSDLISQFGLVKNGCRYYVTAILDLGEGFDPKTLKGFGVRLNSRTGNLATALIPTRKFIRFVKSGAVKYVDVSFKRGVLGQMEAME